METLPHIPAACGRDNVAAFQWLQTQPRVVAACLGNEENTVTALVLNAGDDATLVTYISGKWRSEHEYATFRFADMPPLIVNDVWERVDFIRGVQRPNICHFVREGVDLCAIQERAELIMHNEAIQSLQDMEEYVLQGSGMKNAAMYDCTTRRNAIAFDVTDRVAFDRFLARGQCMCNCTLCLQVQVGTFDTCP